MTRELYLLRHAKSDRSLEIEDFDRPLKKRGKRNAEQIGVYLQQHHLLPDLILSSPAKRAISTAKRVRTASNNKNIIIQQDMRLYASSVDCLKMVLSKCPSHCQRILLVGHNPELEDLLIDLVGAKNVPTINKLLPTAALARLTMPSDWTQLQAQCAELVNIVYARSLP
ncbi:MAG: histidine phosphatase family protein [Methylococcaceae bacterium]